jgi:tripartite-type tricarboxylate transporter receptor subunit TctC
LLALRRLIQATRSLWHRRSTFYAAGSAGDVLGRIFASRLSELLGQPVIFENVGRAGGMMGASRMAKAAPDGYRL